MVSIKKEIEKEKGCMMKYLMMLSMVVFPTVTNAQYHSLSGGPVTDIPAFSWQNPGWSEGSTAFNASHHQLPMASTPTMGQSYNGSSAGSSAMGGSSTPASQLNNDFGNMD